MGASEGMAPLKIGSFLFVMMRIASDRGAAVVVGGAAGFIIGAILSPSLAYPEVEICLRSETPSRPNSVTRIDLHGTARFKQLERGEEPVEF